VTAATATDVDRRIAALRATFERTRANLAELDADVTRRTLGDSTSLEGLTASTWARAEQQCADLWNGQLALDGWLDEVTALRGTRPTPPRAVVARLAELLDGAVVNVAAAAEGRSLTDGTAPTVSWTVDALVASMSDAYRSVVAVIASVEAVWDGTLRELEALSSAFARLDTPGRFGGQRPNELARSRRELDSLDRRVRTDPLAVPPGALAPLRKVVERLASEAREEEEATRALAGELDALDASLAACRVAVGEARAEHAGTVPKVAVGDGGDPLDGADAELEAVGAGLAEARQLAGDRPVEARRRAHELQARVDRLRAGLDSVGDSEAAGVAERDELRGRLEALWAKACAGDRSEDLGVGRLYEEAREALYTAPCDLARAGALVVAFQQAVRSTAAPS
jgi:hypothetical protein